MSKAMLRPDVFWSLVNKDCGNGCWEWLFTINGSGYGQFTAGRDTIMAHRHAYEIWSGTPIPDGLTVDHLCRNKHCVNPAHLELVSAAENNRRADGYAGINARKTHCNHGHLLDDANVYRYRGWRVCRQCAAVARQKYNARKMAAR